MVTGVVGEHRDARLLEVRVHQEHVVLEPPPALGEAQVVRVEERAPEQLVRREQPDQRLPLEVDARAVAAEQVARHRLAVADDLADHDVGVVAHRHRVHPLQRLLAEVVVVVDVEHVVAARAIGAEVARATGPARVGDVLDMDVGVLRGERVEPRRGRVGRAVVDEDHLVLVGRQRLAEQRPDAVVDVAARVEDRDDDGDLHEAGWTAGAGS